MIKQTKSLCRAKGEDGGVAGHVHVEEFRVAGFG